MYTTKAQAINYLVGSYGAQANLANATVNEYCSSEHNEVDTDQPYTPAELENAYFTFTEMAKITPEGIEFDGEVLFDLAGNYLPR